MKKIVLSYLFYKYRDFFEEKMVEEFMAKTSDEVKEPALDFLAHGKQKLEKWILFQSYFMQRKAVNDISKAQFYQGAMLYLAIFLKVISQHKVIRTEIPKGKEIGESPEEKTKKAISDLKIYEKKKDEEK